MEHTAKKSICFKHKSNTDSFQYFHYRIDDDIGIANFLTMIFVSLFKRLSILILKACDKSFNCSGLGAVSFSPQLDIVCLITPTISPNASCDRFASFLSLKIFSPNIMLPTFRHNTTNFLFLPSSEYL